MRSSVVKTDVPGDRLPWKAIGACAAVGAVIGVSAVVTSQGLDSLPATVASLLVVILGMAIIGGLWAATFFTTDH